MDPSPTSGNSTAADAWPRAEVDLVRSRLLIHTKATGLLARFAHDLEIEARALEIDARVDAERWSVELRAPIERMRVTGVRRGERVDERVLSRSDQEEIHRRLREQVFAGMDAIRVHAEGRSREQGEATVVAKAGRQNLVLRSRVDQSSGGALVVSGRCTLSLGKLGVPEVKGPLGAFRIHDDVEIRYSFVVQAAPTSR
jgi:hypothetical protein